MPWKWQAVDQEGAVPEWSLVGPKEVLCRYWIGKKTTEPDLFANAKDLLVACEELLDAYIEENGGCMPDNNNHPAFTARDMIALSKGLLPHSE